MNPPFFRIPGYHDYLSPDFARHLLEGARPVPGIEGLVEVGEGGGLETPDALRFLARLYERLEPALAEVLRRRARDRKFIDERTRALSAFNRELGRDFLDPDYQTVLGLEDSEGRVVFGPRSAAYCRAGGEPIAPLPEFLKGPHVTLFGPPDDAKMAINAMNAYHRRLPGEPAIVEALLASQKASPMWGADDEDSKTPLRGDLVEAAVNLTACFEGDLSLQEGAKRYELARERLALPMKRFPGLALPSTFLFLRESPIPLHLYDFALHLFRNWADPRALVFYVPKLENEEEARYVRQMVSAAEAMIRELHPAYALGTVRLMIVLENPRAIVRAHEIMDELHPYFAGASLGWHDYLASTARLFKEDSNYRIPVKADPGIVIKYIKASHRLLADVVGPRGGIKVGGMYGILPLAGDAESLQITLRGFFKDVIIQLKRELTGFWVAHPDFVRVGLAIVEAWRLHAQGDPGPLSSLVRGLLDEKRAAEVLEFIRRPDIEGLDRDDPGYVRSLTVTDLKESDFIANHHPDEIRYNVFQSLQYLADWLCGNGCVALPTIIDGVAVRVMDDLATAERSRWEVWHELRHGRFAVEDFIEIAHEEMNFIRRDLSDGKKIVQVKWDARTAKWYPIAYRIMLKLMTDPEPPEFATELLMPFTVEAVRNDPDPWEALCAIDPFKVALPRYVADFDHYFELCGVPRFAREMASNPIEDRGLAERIILGFSRDEVLAAASFHGDIGQSKATLDARAAGEQAAAHATAGEETARKLRELGTAYRARFGFKFLVSAKGKPAGELLAELERRIGNEGDEELRNARLALWEITRKRMDAAPRDLAARLDGIRGKHGVAGLSVAVNYRGGTQALAFGESVKGGHPDSPAKRVAPGTCFQLASLSKTIGSAFALEYFRRKGIPPTASVNGLLAKTGSKFRLCSPSDPAWADRVTIADLMSHSALNMHYVPGIPVGVEMPGVGELIEGDAGLGYEAVQVVEEPGRSFRYSGGGFLALEHLIEAMEGASIAGLMEPFLDEVGVSGIRLGGSAKGEEPVAKDIAHGYFDSGEAVPRGGYRFPAFAAGMLGSARDMAVFLQALGAAHQSVDGVGGISHDTAVEMLHGQDRGSRAFMGCLMGLGVFTAEAGPNRLAIHQGANEGFRAIFIHCFAGPDRGKGVVALCNGDNRAVAMIAEAVREILLDLRIEGIDFERLSSEFRFAGLAQEQIVNLGYKQLVFDAFQPDLPEEISAKGPLDPLADRNLAVSARIVDVTNQKFARAENLLSPRLPVFDPDLFGRQGKVMDSWESARHNPRPCDTLEIELRAPSEIRYVSLSTKFHDGNQPEFVRLEGLEAQTGQWRELLPKTRMAGHSLFRADLGQASAAFSRVRVEIYPDGGLSRLGLFKDLPGDAASEFAPLAQARCARFEDAIPRSRKPLTIPYRPPGSEIERNLKAVRGARDVDWASLALGGAVVGASNEHYGPAAQVISPYPPLHMFDGMESARSREPGHSEQVVIRLARPVPIDRVLLDFTYFVNNNPLEVSIDGKRNGAWVELVGRTRVKAFAGSQREFAIPAGEPVTEILVRAYPDGGINRVRVLGPAV